MNNGTNQIYHMMLMHNEDESRYVSHTLLMTAGPF